MQYIHVKNISKYNPGYTDRQHIWAKIYWNIFIDEDYQNLCEIDRHRLIGLIVFETYSQKPVALTPVNIALIGWDTKKRAISLTIQMLHKFIEVRNENVTQNRVEESRIEKNRIEKKNLLVDYEYLKNQEFKTTFDNYLLGRKKKATEHAKELLLKDLHKHNIQTAIKMLEQSIKNGWVGVFELKQEKSEYKKDMEIIKENKKPNPDCKLCNGLGKRYPNPNDKTIVVSCGCWR